LAPLSPYTTLFRSADLAAFPNDPGDRARGRRDHREIDRLRDLGDGRERRDTENAAARGVDRVDGAPEGAAHHVPEERAPDAAGVVGGADNGDAPRIEEGIERAAIGPGDVERGISAALGPRRCHALQPTVSSGRCEPQSGFAMARFRYTAAGGRNRQAGGKHRRICPCRFRTGWWKGSSRRAPGRATRREKSAGYRPTW